MALPHTDLPLDALSPDAQQALASESARMMAARGLAPLPNPGDMIAVLYQLTLDSNPEVCAAAQQSVGALPERLLANALTDEAVDPRVLDYFAGQLLEKPTLLQRILLNRAVADETVAELANLVGEAEIELIAQNEQQLLRHPAIIAAMYHNPQARMSTVDRAVELAARNQIAVPDIPGWDELARLVLGQAQDASAAAPPEESDALFAQALAVNSAETNADAQDEHGKPKQLPIGKMTIPMKVRLATMGNAFARATLVRDPIRIVALAAIKAPGVTDVEAAKYASNHSLSDDVVQYVSSRRDWTRLYSVKLALVQNPKNSIQAATRLMPHIREKDLRLIARSKNVPSAIAAQARKLLMTRKGSGKR